MRPPEALRGRRREKKPTLEELLVEPQLHLVCTSSPDDESWTELGMGWFGLEEDVNPSRPTPRPPPSPSQLASFPPFGSRPLSPTLAGSGPRQTRSFATGGSEGRGAPGGARRGGGRHAGHRPVPIPGAWACWAAAGAARRGHRGHRPGAAWIVGDTTMPPAGNPPGGGAPAGVAGGGRAVREPPRPPPGARAPAAPAGHRGRRRARRHAKERCCRLFVKQGGRGGAGPPSVLPSGASCGLAPPALGSPAGVRTAGDLVGGWGQRARAGKPGGGGLTGPTRAPPPSSPPACRAGR